MMVLAIMKFAGVSNPDEIIGACAFVLVTVGLTGVSNFKM